jgi:transposase-like protein
MAMNIDNNTIIRYFSDLSESNQKQLISDLNGLCVDTEFNKILGLRGDALDDRRSECPHCKSASYVKNGVDKGSRKYKCKDCKRGFTEFTGTWVAGLHKKHKIPEFLKALEHKLSLVNSGKEVGLDPSTIFTWRHKFLSAHQNMSDQKSFKGITESDETLYLHSQKGTPCKHRAPRKRGGRPTSGHTNDEAVLLTTMDREGNKTYELITMGRVSHKDLDKAIGDRITPRTILCTDGLTSYGPLCRKYKIEHHAFNTKKGPRVNGDYHIQHVNNLHTQMKTLYNHILKGVSTKYLQKYANWQKVRELYKEAKVWTNAVMAASMQRVDAQAVYRSVKDDHSRICLSSLFAS